MDYLESNEELQHHGVKGMKWGVRKARKEVHNLRKMASRANDESTARQLNAAADKKASELSDQERELAKVERARQLKKGAAAVGAALVLVGGMYIAGKQASARKVERDAAKKARKSEKLDNALKKAAEKVKNKGVSQKSKKVDSGVSIVNMILARSGGDRDHFDNI